MRIYICFASEFMSYKCTYVYASVKYLIISNRFLKRTVCVSETSRIFILDMSSKNFKVFFSILCCTQGLHFIYAI